jgi:hypothetical protein
MRRHISIWISKHIHISLICIATHTYTFLNDSLFFFWAPVTLSNLNQQIFPVTDIGFPLNEGCLICVICVWFLTLVANTYCVVFLLYFSSYCVPYVVGFSELSFVIAPTVFSNVYILTTLIEREPYIRHWKYLLVEIW